MLLIIFFIQKRILDIALDLQYESQESFTRAFKNEYGITPGKYRKNNSYSMLLERLDVEKILNTNIKKEVFMEPIIKRLGEIKIIGAQLKTDTENGNNFKQIPQFWNQFLK